MCSIISVVLGWDSAEFKKTVDRIEKDEKAPSKEVLAAIKELVRKSPRDRAAAREKSARDAKSIIAVVLEDSDVELDKALSEEQHGLCQEYLSALLSIRDRDEIVNVLCKSSPDLFTQAVRDVVAGFEPYIRAVHEKVDLREHITDFQSFVDQFIAVGKGRKVQTDAGTAEYSPPTVEDFAGLLRGNKEKLYKWLHYGAKSAPDVTEIFRNWANETVVHFRKPGVPVKGSSSHVEGTMVEQVGNLFAELPEEKKKQLIPIVDAHAAYLDAISQISRSRVQDILDGDSETMAGPGIFLVMWQSLLDNTAITPAAPDGPVRKGRDVREEEVQGKTDLTATDAWHGGDAARHEAINSLPEAPDVAPVVEALGAAFRSTIATTEAGDDGQSDLSID